MEFVTTWSMRSNSWQTSKKDGDSPVKMLVTGLQERSRLKMMHGLRRFVMVDKYEAMKVGE